MKRTFRSRLASASTSLLLSTTFVATALPAAPAAAAGTSCQATGTWTPGELNTYFFDVEQGDSQLIVGPTGITMLVDLGENVWNRTTGTNAERVAQAIRDICDVPTGQVHLDYVVMSHLHLDHIGYAGNPSDTTSYGNGIYQLLNPAGLDFSVGQLVTRDGGFFQDSDGNGTCEVGTNASPSPDVVYTNAGTMSSTGRRWICWVDGPAGQADRANIDGKVLTLTNDLPSWPSFDLGPGVTAEILQANAKGIMQADGVTPVSGNHVNDPTPPSENDYSVAMRFVYGDYEYATAGDADGEYNTSSYGYSYNDVEGPLAPLFGDVETMRVNHHGSSHSTSNAYTTTLAPETAVISCGSNTYGHPAANVLSELNSVVTSEGVGADVFMTNNPCDSTVGTVGGAFNNNGDIHFVTTSGGAGYVVNYDAGSRAYTSHVDDGTAGGGGTPPPPPPPPPGGTSGDPMDVNISELRFRGAGGASDEFVEILNTGTDGVDISGWALEGCAGGSGVASNRVTVPAGTILAAGQFFLFANNSYTGSVAPDLTWSTGISDSGGARIVDAAGIPIDGFGDKGGSSECREGTGLNLTTASNDESYFRDGDGTTDTDKNQNDFTGPVASDPQNSSSNGGGGGTPPPTGTVGDIVINEYVADNAAFATEWVELFNPTGSEVDISGLFIDDIAGGGGSPQAIPAGTTIAAGGHYVFAISGFLLNNGGDDVRLLTADQATVIDSHTYGSSADDQSWRRAGDGGTWCGSYGAATQGTANPATC